MELYLAFFGQFIIKTTADTLCRLIVCGRVSKIIPVVLKASVFTV